MLKTDDPMVKYLIDTFNLCLTYPGKEITLADKKYGLKMTLFRHDS